MDSVSQVSAPAVGKSFVLQYYHILYNMPEHLYRFYQEMSKVGRVGQDGVMRVFSTLQGITEELKTLSYGDFKSANITSYDIQESLDGSFLLVVTGYFSLNERFQRKFTQTFFLAPQENGYFVLNDILRFFNEPDAVDVELVSGTPTPINVNQGSEEAAWVSAKEDSEPLSTIEYASASTEQVLVPEIIKEGVPDTEVADDLLKMSDPNDGLEDVPKKSYASVLKVTRDKPGVSTGCSLSPKQIPKDQDHQASLDPSLEEIHKDEGHQVSSVIESVAVSEGVNATENGLNQGFEAVAEGTSVYVRHLPANANVDMLDAEFKRFGAISSDGIQVVKRGFGFPFGFVEFEEADAAQRAVEASPVVIGGQRVFVEEKRSTSRGNRGSGNRNVGVRGGRGRGSGSYGYRRGGGGGGRTFYRTSNEYDNTY